MKFPRKYLAALSFTLCTTYQCCAIASEVSTSDDNNAQAELQKVSNYYKGLTSLSGQLHVDVKTRHNGPWQHNRTRTQFKLKRPDYLFISTKQKKLSGTAVIEGANCFLYSPEWHMYVKKQFNSWMDVFANSDFSFITNGTTKTSYLQAIVSSNPGDLILDGVTEVHDLGIETIHSAKCHHLTLRKNGSDIDLWLKTGKQPWIVKVVPLKHHDQNMDAVMSISYDRLRANPNVKLAPFRAPISSKEVSHFVVPPGEENQHPLVQLQAPDFQLSTIGGKPFKLSEHRHELLIIDFWATWCEPCCRALPGLVQIAESYKDRGVALLAVNQEEEPETIRAFLKKSDLNLCVGMDRDGKVCSQYHVGGIPQTVLVDRDGVVRVVHIGNSPNFKEELTREIEKILQATLVEQKFSGEPK